MDRPHLQKTFFCSLLDRRFALSPGIFPSPKTTAAIAGIILPADVHDGDYHGGLGGQVSGGANVRAFVVDAGARVRVSISEKRLWFAF